MLKYFIPCLALLVNACNSQTSVISFTDPVAVNTPIINTLLLNQGLEQTWQGLLTKLKNSPYEIVQADQQNYFLRLEGTGNPAQFIDCGSKTIHHAKQTNKIINTAKNYQYTIYQSEFSETFQIYNHFIGTADILLSGNKTSSEITLHFILELATKIVQTSSRGQLFNTSETFHLNLNAGQEEYFPAFDASCRSRGKFEKQTLDLLTNWP